jgi:hypothetical protein
VSNVTFHPLLIFVLSFAALWLTAWVGAWLRKKEREQEADFHDDLGVILAATLTLLALIIGFSFSMATTRYDQRKNYEEQEANAIGTEYLRADLLSPVDAAKVRSLLRSYLDQRILFFAIHDEEELRQISVRTVRLQAELWAAVKPAAAEQPTPVVALVIAGMNDVLNAQGDTQAAFRNRIPTAAWGLMMAIAICCNMLFGHSLRSKARAKLLVVLPIVISIAFMLVADIDTPRHGIVRLSPQNLTSLAESLRVQ